jgi:hypothetical protein
MECSLRLGFPANTARGVVYSSVYPSESARLSSLLSLHFHSKGISRKLLGNAMMYIVPSLAIGLSVFSFASATGTLQLDFKRDEELSRRILRKRQSHSNPSTTLQLENGLLYFADVSVRGCLVPLGNPFCPSPSIRLDKEIPFRHYLTRYC